MGPTTARRAGVIWIAAISLVASASAVASAPVSAAPTCHGRVATITDNDGNDRDPRRGIIKGTPGDDVIVGSSRSEVIHGQGGNDIICGGRGDDRISGDAGADRIKGGHGDDHILGRRGRDRLWGQRGADHLDGGAGTDRCQAGPGGVSTRRCEVADLSVELNCNEDADSLDGPNVAPAKNLAEVYRYHGLCFASATNRGPDITKFTMGITASETKGDGTCQIHRVPEETSRWLRPGEAFSVIIAVNDCDITIQPTVIRLTVRGVPVARDPRQGNNVASLKARLAEG